MADVIPIRGTLTVDGKLVDPDYLFPCKPAIGDYEWQSDEGPIVLRYIAVEPYTDQGEQRYHVRATKAH